MKNYFKYFIILIICFSIVRLQAQNTPKTITFPSLDGVSITADVYHVADTLPIILLCHQASYSRGEYIESALELNKLGFNCMAIDQRSGKEVNNIVNKTAADARNKRRPVNYWDAEMDLIAGINYLIIKYKKDVILLGSSYSASLALKVAKEHDKVRAAIGFSPGEYFKSYVNLTESIRGLEKPVFVTSSRGESKSVGVIVEGLPNVTHFVPKAEGAHGSKVLWSTHSGREEYWEALKDFLAKIEK